MNEEVKKTIKANQNHRLFMFWFIFLMSIIMSFAIVQMITGSESYFEYFFVNPFDGSEKGQKYISENPIFIGVMIFMSINFYLFHFGNPKKGYIKKIDKMRIKSLDYIPFYFSGSDERNMYIKYGFEEALKHGFLERKIFNYDYLPKVSHLSVFTQEFSPDVIMFHKRDKRYKFQTKDVFTSDEVYIELFRIIEKMLTNNTSAIINVDIKAYRAIGTDVDKFSKNSLIQFSNDYIPKEDNKTWSRNREQFKRDIESMFSLFKKNKSSKKQIEKKIISYLTKLNKEKGVVSYSNFLRKMVIFSPLALRQMIEIVYNDAVRYYEEIATYRTSVYYAIHSMGYQKIDEFFEILKFLVFYKVVSNFMGLPSGIITARMSDYNWKRIVDDIEHFEASQAIRQIKSQINDEKGRYNDIVPRNYMIFHHEFFKNSKHSHEIQELFERFNPLPDTAIISMDEDTSSLSNSLVK